MNSKIARALTIAGSDSSGGAGIQADLKTFAVLGCYGMSVITALTAQNTRGVHGVFPVSAEFISAQAEAVISDIGCDAVKTGMLHSNEAISAVARCVTTAKTRNIVVDPVMVAKNGATLLNPDAVAALKFKLIPLALLITPNLPEAQVLLETDISTEAQMEQAASDLLALGCKAVLLKGGHLDGQSSDDCLAFKNGGAIETRWLRQPKIASGNTHGTGCTLSAAITAFLARGIELPEAVLRGKEFVTSALVSARNFQIGVGVGPVDPLPSLRLR